MTSEFSNLIEMPWIQRRARLKEIARSHPTFRTYLRKMEMVRLAISALLAILFYSLREQMGLIWILGLILTCGLVEWWLERKFTIPCACLHVRKSTEKSP